MGGRYWLRRKKHHLGTFNTEEEAAEAYLEAAKEHHKEFAKSNYEDPSSVMIVVSEV